MSELNLLKAGWSVLWARRVRKPAPAGTGAVDHAVFAATLDLLGGGLSSVDPGGLDEYLQMLQRHDPDDFDRDGALAYWLNLYNAAAVRLAVGATAGGVGSVLRMPGGFDAPVVEVAGERLSLNDVEHGKVRRFGDPRVHGSLVCGSISCPTLRSAPFGDVPLDGALDTQMRSFVAAGGAAVDRDRGVLSLSRIFLWYGADFVRPHRMPALLPAGARRVGRAVAEWLPQQDRAWLEGRSVRVEFQSYDWGLGCAVAP